MKAIVSLLVVFVMVGCAAAAPVDMRGKLLDDKTSADDVLDALDLAGRDLKDFDADVTLGEIDRLRTGAETSRTGKVWFQLLGEGNARIHIVFDKFISNNRQRDIKLEYLLDKGWLTERDYKDKKETRRQVVRPGEKVNLLKLGEGPFPLPIGQSKDDVKAVFDVEKIPAAKGDPVNTVHVKLTPKPDTSYARKFKEVNVFVDAKTHLPMRISTTDRNGAKDRITDMTNFRLNPGLKEEVFTLPDIKSGEWDRQEEEYKD